jgi:hypothetical protein
VERLLVEQLQRNSTFSPHPNRYHAMNLHPLDSLSPDRVCISDLLAACALASTNDRN